MSNLLKLAGKPVFPTGANVWLSTLWTLLMLLVNMVNVLLPINTIHFSVSFKQREVLSMLKPAGPVLQMGACYGDPHFGSCIELI